MSSPQAPAKKAPAVLGYRMPAEWVPHEAIWLSWPHDRDTFPNLQRVEQAYTEIAAAITPGEELRLFVTGPEMRERAARQMKKTGTDLGRVRFYEHPYADVWFRDYGPIFLLSKDGKKRAMTHWIFNAWGGKYPELFDDTKIPELIAEQHPMERFVPGIVLEGGSIEVNGAGTVLTTEQCLLNKNRNPGLSREQIETYLKDYLGVSNVLWLKEGVAGDDTDGHIDDIARFVGPRTVLCACEDDPKDANHAILKENFELLKSMKDQDGKRLEVLKLPMPGPVCRKDGSRLPASYANFYIGTDTVMVPTFSHENDAKALEIIAKAFPNRKTVGIECTAVVHGLGTLHCISQQQPSPY